MFIPELQNMVGGSSVSSDVYVTPMGKSLVRLLKLKENKSFIQRLYFIVYW